MYELSQTEASFTHPYIFLIYRSNLFVCALFSTCSNCYMVLPTNMQLILVRTHQQMASNSQCTLCPLSLPAKKQVVSPSYAQSNAQKDHPHTENFLTIGSCFKHYTYRVTALGWLKKERRKKERKKMNNSDFQPFQVCHFKIVTTKYILLLLLQTGAGSTSCSMYFNRKYIEHT